MLTIIDVRKKMDRRIEDGLREYNDIAKEKVGFDFVPAVKDATKKWITDSDIQESLDRGLAEEEWMRRFEISMENLIGEAMILIVCYVNDKVKKRKEKKGLIKHTDVRFMEEMTR